MTSLRPFLAAAFLSLFGQGLTVPSAVGQAPPLPFKVNPDGSVDQRDLLKLTKRPTASDRITDAELESIKSKHKIEYGAGFRPTEGPEMPPRGDLYASSAILSDGANHTLIPKEAVVWIPEELKGRLVEKPVGRLILWPDFLKQNRSWLRPMEVSFEMATGDVPLSEDQLESVRQSPAIVVSVMKDHPISLLGPKVTVETAIAAAPTGAKAPLLATTPAAKGAAQPSSADPDPEATQSKPASSRASRFDFSNRFKSRLAK